MRILWILWILLPKHIIIWSFPLSNINISSYDFFHTHIIVSVIKKFDLYIFTNIRVYWNILFDESHHFHYGDIYKILNIIPIVDLNVPLWTQSNSLTDDRSKPCVQFSAFTTINKPWVNNTKWSQSGMKIEIFRLECYLSPIHTLHKSWN